MVKAFIKKKGAVSTNQTRSNSPISRCKRNVNKVAIKNGQSRDTGNIDHTRHRTTTSKTKNTTQHRNLKKMSNMDPTNKPADDTKSWRWV